MADIVDLMLATGCRIGEVLALRWSDLDLDGDLPILTVSGTIKTETGKGTYRKATPKSDASRRTVVLPRFAAELLRVRRECATHNEIDAVFATADSGESQRCRLTVEPFAKAANLPVNVRFSHKQVQALVEELRAKCDGKNTLVCWHHGEIPELLTALGADPAVLLPGGDWPGSVFDWLVVLTFDHEGKLIPAQSKRLYEHLLPRDP